MAVRIIPGYREQLIGHVLTELAARENREEAGVIQYQTDIADWSEKHFYIPRTMSPVKLPLHQKAILRYFFTRRENRHFPFQTVTYSTVKKSGKSTTAGIIGRYFAETQTHYGEIFTIGNDLEQAKDRSFKEIVRSLELTPGFNPSKETLPGRWSLHKLSMKCLLTGSTIKAIAVDAKGEAGGQQALTIWTELWGAENTEAKRFWDEMQPIPTVPDSVRLVETYAGYDGESELLHSVYDRGIEGKQLTAGELAEFVCREDVPGETFDDFVRCWHETNGDPTVLIPVWANTNAGVGMYWDSGLSARRMPWQHMFLEQGSDICGMCLRLRTEHDIGVTANEYYSAAEAQGPPPAYRRLHLNEWVGAESAFVPMESWDHCGHIHKVTPLLDGERTMLVLAADAAVTGDCFGILAVNRCPEDSQSVDIRAVRKWDPKDTGGVINLDEPEAFMRAACKINNVVQIAYDPFQLENTAQRLRKDGIAWLEPFNQAQDRLKADSQLYDLIMALRIHYSHAENCPEGVSCNCNIASLREHIANANAKMQLNEDSKLRIVKKTAGKKIDLCVCLSMAAARCLYLRLA